MPDPPVSCVIPVLNGERYLAAALDSVLEQTLPVDEIVVVDDGSTDATPEIAVGYEDRIRYIAQDRVGMGGARDRGIEAAQGEWIAFLDADDLWDPEKIERQARHFQDRPETGALFTYAQNFWAEELRAEAERFRDHRIAKPQPAYIPSTLMARRSVFEAVGGFGSARRHAETLDWVLRAQRAGVRIEILPEVLTRRRLHARNVSRLERNEMLADFLDLLKSDLDLRRREARAADERS